MKGLTVCNDSYDAKVDLDFSCCYYLSSYLIYRDLKNWVSCLVFYPSFSDREKEEDKCLVQGFQQGETIKGFTVTETNLPGRYLTCWGKEEPRIIFSHHLHVVTPELRVCSHWARSCLGIIQSWALLTPCVTDMSKMEYKVSYYLKIAVTVLWRNSGR